MLLIILVSILSFSFILMTKFRPRARLCLEVRPGLDLVLGSTHRAYYHPVASPRG